MAAPMTADQMVAQLRAYGLKVVEYRDWRHHNRNSVGAWGPVNGVMIHHTVTSGSQATVELIYNGHSRLPGPLALGCVTKDGTVHLVGNGRANHAGKGDSRVFNRVVNEDYGTRPPAPGPGDMDGNRHFYGFECENRGDGKDPWPQAQLEAIERASAAICDWHDWTEKSVIGHLEWTNQKIDPRGFTMPWMREQIKNRIGNPGTTQEDEMQLGDEIELTQWIKDRFPDDPGIQDGSIQVSTTLASGYAHARTASTLARAALSNTEKLLAAVQELAARGAARDAVLTWIAEGGGLDTAEVQRAAEAGATAALDRLAIALTAEAEG